MTRSQLNEIYRSLDAKAREISALFHRPVGWYNGHYRKGESGTYEKDYYPIPEVTIPALCDVEIGLDGITVTTKLTRSAALSYDYAEIAAYDFEVYGVEDYLNDFRTPDGTTEAMLERIRKSAEATIFFSFTFPFDTSPADIQTFVDFLRVNGFFY